MVEAVGERRPLGSGRRQVIVPLFNPPAGEEVIHTVCNAPAEGVQVSFAPVKGERVTAWLLFSGAGGNAGGSADQGHYRRAAPGGRAPVLGLGQRGLRLRREMIAMHYAILILILAVNLPAASAAAEEPKVAANIYNQAEEEVLTSPQTSDGARSRLVKDPQARTGYALVADPADRQGAGFAEREYLVWLYLPAGTWKIRGTFRLKVADNTTAKPVVGIRVAVANGDLKSGQSASRALKGTDFTVPNTYQEFSLDVLKGEQGFGDWGVNLLPGATKVSFDGLSVKQVSTFGMAELLANLNPPVKPAGLTVNTGPLLVHETHGLYMELWGVRQALGLLPKPLGAQWTQSYLNTSSQRTALAGYPTKWEDLYRHRGVVLNNAPAQAVTIVGVLMLKEYLRDGGCVVMMGDTHSLVAGGWNASVLSPLLPVTLTPTNFVHAAAPLVLTPRTEAIRKLGLDWSAQPCTLYYHPAVVKPEGKVLVAAGDVPLVVEGPVGKGRIVVFLNAVLGKKTPARRACPSGSGKTGPR